MNLIIPMAGKGTRLRPQTLTTPKPLIEIAGRTIVQRIVDLLSNSGVNQIQNIGFIIEQKSPETEKMLYLIGQENNINVHIFYQEKALGTAEHCTKCSLDRHPPAHQLADFKRVGLPRLRTNRETYSASTRRGFHKNRKL